jgi:hypothetical protein
MKAQAQLRPALPDPPYAADEKITLSAFLDWYRDVMLRKVEGLTTEEATRKLVPSPTNLLGLIKHLAYVERGWFQGSFLGMEFEDVPWSDADPDADFRVEPGESVASVTEFYRKQCERSREIAAAAKLDDKSKRPDRKDHTLRWIMVHMIEETARHAGHADILRELTDGATGE